MLSYTLSGTIAGKILARILLNTITEHLVDRVVSESQCGFRQNRGIVDIVFAIRQLQERWLYLIIQAQLRLSGHVMRMEDTRLPKQLFFSELVRGTRKQGGHIKRYKAAWCQKTRTNRRNNSATAVPCPVCGRICASVFGLRSHQRLTSPSLRDGHPWWWSATLKLSR